MKWFYVAWNCYDVKLELDYVTVVANGVFTLHLPIPLSSLLGVCVVDGWVFNDPHDIPNTCWFQLISERPLIPVSFLGNGRLHSFKQLNQMIRFNEYISIMGIVVSNDMWKKCVCILFPPDYVTPIEKRSHIYIRILNNKLHGPYEGKGHLRDVVTKYATANSFCTLPTITHMNTNTILLYVESNGFICTLHFIFYDNTDKMWTRDTHIIDKNICLLTNYILNGRP